VAYVIWRTAPAAVTCHRRLREQVGVRCEGASIRIQAQLFTFHPALSRAAIRLRSPTARYVGGVLLFAASYYGAAKVGQTLRYTASVSAIWPPVGLGIAVLYLWGLRWWPGVFLGELIVNGELLLGSNPLPLGSLVGQQAGNMAEIFVGAVLLRELIGPRAALDRVEQVGGLLIALGTATAISATVGTLSMLAGGVIDTSAMAKFWRTWWLGDTSGGLVVLPLLLTWAPSPGAAWRRIASWEGALLIVTVTALGSLAISTDEPVTYMIFPALIWAAYRFGPPGATLAIAIAAGIAIGVTANDVGPFYKQPIDHRTLSTQAYIVVVALTTLFLSALVCERERSLTALAEAKRHEGEQALEERRRISRELHDSVSQSLFSTALQTRAAQKAATQNGMSSSPRLEQALNAIAELTRSAQREMRTLIFELGKAPRNDGLVDGLAKHAATLAERDDLEIELRRPDHHPALSPEAETQLFAITREALSNVVKHAGATRVAIRVEVVAGRVLIEVSDDGRGFDPSAGHPGHFGLESMRSRAAEVGGALTITSAPGKGTVVRVEAPIEPEEVPVGA
jgi:signal transduction histidine kinase